VSPAEELDRLEPLGDATSFAAWLYGWKARAIREELTIRVEVARDRSHARVILDPSASVPRDLSAGVQLELF
jgi:hypothetical protein